jgi:uncharacterized membrane protein
VSDHRRIEAVDLLRGTVMIVMALDHVRHYFGGIGVSPTDLATTTVPLFMTRWVTHICAPVFFLLTGTSAYLSARRRPRGDLARLLFTRGLWLVVLDAVVVRFAFQFNFDYHVTILTVFWAIGWSMVALSALVGLRPAFVFAIGAMMIALHNLLDPISPAAFGSWAPLWTALHAQGFLLNVPGYVVLSAYPLIPWIGVTAAGFGLAVIFDWPRERRRHVLLVVGTAMTAAFVVLRWSNLYGDPVTWTVQPSPSFSVLSFLNTTKNPPSLLFLLMTLGPSLLLLSAFDRPAPSRLRAVLTFGRVPMFYFLLHLFAIHALAVVVCFARYGSVHWMFESPDLAHFPFSEPPGWPLRLPMVYAIWIGVVAALYPVCRWYADVKARSANPWLSYL